MAASQMLEGCDACLRRWEGAPQHLVPGTAAHTAIAGALERVKEGAGMGGRLLDGACRGGTSNATAPLEHAYTDTWWIVRATKYIQRY